MYLLCFLLRDGNGVIVTPGFVFVQSRRLLKLRENSTDTIGNKKKEPLKSLSGVFLLF